MIPVCIGSKQWLDLQEGTTKFLRFTQNRRQAENVVSITLKQSIQQLQEEPGEG